MKFETKVIHAGVHPDPDTGAIMTPIYQTSTYVQERPGVHKGYEYARTQNPTRDVLQENLAALENGKHGFAFASGLAAMDAILKLLSPSDEILSCNDLYGGSYRLIRQIYEKYGIKANFVDFSDMEEIRRHLSSKTRLVWIETPTNPTLKVFDIQAICECARSASDAMICVDNTFASPYLQQPLDLGADLVHHSATKYIGGHSDLVLGAVVVNSDAIAQQLGFVQNAAGAVPGPQDCFLCLRGIKTLHVRVDRACENAMTIAQYLENHDKVKNVFYPGLDSHPQKQLASRQMKHFGAMVSFELKNEDIESAHKVLSGTQLFSLAESLGGVESLIGHPASMTHASIPREERLAAGLSDGLIRLSVGIENIDDLVADLESALDAL